MTGSEGAGLRWGRFYLYEAYGNASGIGVTVWDRGMGIWSAAEVSDKYANEGNKNLFRGGEISSIGLPTVRDGNAASEVGSNEEKHSVLGTSDENDQ